jgi:hypothetical protein
LAERPHVHEGSFPSPDTLILGRWHKGIDKKLRAAFVQHALPIAVDRGGVLYVLTLIHSNCPRTGICGAHFIFSHTDEYPGTGINNRSDSLAAIIASEQRR